MSRKLLLGAGAALALMCASAATASNAQSPPSTTPGGGLSNEEVQRNMDLAAKMGLAPFVMRTNDKDAYGRPRWDTLETAIRTLGPDVARLQAYDDRDYCSMLSEQEQLLQEIADADKEVKAADEAARIAQTSADRKQAKAQQGRARTNFISLLLTGLRVGLVSQIPGVGWAYAGYVVASEFNQYLDREQHKLEMEASDERVTADSARVHANDLRLKALDLRLKLWDGQNRAWRYSMGLTCKSQDRFYSKMPALTGPQGASKPQGSGAPAPARGRF